MKEKSPEQRESTTMEKTEEIIEVSRNMIESEPFKEQHRSDSKAFTRTRILTFPRVILFILEKSVKSIQLRLNEWFGRLGKTVSSSAMTQARANLKHTAFIALNAVLIKIFYRDDNYQRYEGFRVLAIDGSKVRLPKGDEIKEEFGSIRYRNQKEEVKGEHNYAQVSVLYDVMNRIAIAAEFAKALAYEVDLAIKHLTQVQKGDLLIGDRNYASGRFIDAILTHGVDLVIRCSASSFKVARKMLQGCGADSQIATLKIEKGREIKIVQVRFVRVKLSTGEYEVLVTSLLDKQVYPTEMFKELYHLRWGIETYYGLLKTRLELENFTGKTVESILQDFYATLYLTNLESVLIQETETELKSKEGLENQQQVNHQVSFHAIKSSAIEILLSGKPVSEVLSELRALFLRNPTLKRKRPSEPRKLKTARQSLHYHRTQRKHCF
jgi:hypothetical protein